MKLSEIIKTYDCRVYHEELLFDKDIDFAFCSDLMSDALVIMNSVKDDRILDHSILITGLATQQSIRTAEMLDVNVVLLVRGKIPSDKVIQLALESHIILISTDYTMFNISGMMYQKGIRGIKYDIQW
jgi:predicted transcriptional regulator